MPAVRSTVRLMAHNVFRRSAQPWFSRPEAGVVRRALWIAVAWAYVAVLAALVVIAVAALVALIVVLIVYLLDFSSRRFEIDTVLSPAILVAWVVFPAAGAVAIWTAAYGSTRRRSVGRGTAAIAIGTLGGVGMWLTGSLALPMLALALGWTIAIPAEHAARWLARIALAVALVPAFPTWDGAGLGVVASAAAIGPLAAGLSVYLGDLGWTLAVRLRSRGDGGVVRSPTSLDV